MTTEAQLRKAALGLPEVEERTHFGAVAYYVRNEGFASVTPGGEVRLRLSPEDVEAALADHPTAEEVVRQGTSIGDRKSTRLNSSHVKISYAVFCLKKKNTQ